VSSFREKVEAVVAWGWENQDFYAKWMKDDDPAIAATLKGPILNPGSPSTGLAPAIVELVRNVLLRDPEYVARIKRHYRMFKDRIEGRSKAGPKIIRLPKKP
jgi:hypothetical protein